MQSVRSLTRSRRPANGRRFSRLAGVESLETRAMRANLAMFFDAAYVATGAGGEGSELRDSLTALGHSVSTFTGLDAASFQQAIAGADALVIPEADLGNFATDLSLNAKFVIREFVAQGRGLIVAADTGNGGTEDVDVLNSVFGWTLTDVTTPAASSLNATAAAGTRFAGGPSILPPNNQVSALGLASLPAGSRALYKSAANNVYIAQMPFFDGQVVYLGWDWFSATPAPGTQDGGWIDVLNRAVNEVTHPRVQMAIFFNGVFVDTAASGEATELRDSILNLGHDVTTFTGLSAADFTSALAGKDILVFPETDLNDFAAALPIASKTVIADFVARGGGLVIASDSGSGTQDRDLLNSIFGFAVTDVSTPSSSTFNPAAAAGTLFAGGPASLPQNNQVAGLGLASLPAGSRAIYNSQNNATYVALMPHEAGEIAYLGWDWFDASSAPGAQDGGWNDVLDRAIRNLYHSGDFDHNDTYSCGDINQIVNAIANQVYHSFFDLNLDGQINQADIDLWLAEAGAAELLSGNPYLRGDANLDGNVDGTDFNRWNRSKFTFKADWCSGDFNADGAVDVSDFNIWNGNKFTAADDLSARNGGTPPRDLFVEQRALFQSLKRKSVR
jgi:hypothetical protein